MSYILEALKKAERERAQGQIGATSDGVAAAQPAPASRVLIKVLIAVLVVNALVFAAILLRPGRSASAPKAGGVQTPSSAMPSSDAPPETRTLSRPAPATIAPPSQDEAVIEQGVASMDDLGAVGETQDLHVEAAPEAAPAPPRGRVTFAPKPLTPEISAPAATLPAEEVEVLEEPEPVAAPGNAAGYKSLSDMSAAYQGTFPHLKIEVHVYDEQPQRRFALIEGKRYREGDTLPQGPRIVQIVPDGIVVDFRNERVRFPIGRH